jgi:hypothetical protein
LGYLFLPRIERSSGAVFGCARDPRPEIPDNFVETPRIETAGMTTPPLNGQVNDKEKAHGIIPWAVGSFDMLR